MGASPDVMLFLFSYVDLKQSFDDNIRWLCMICKCERGKLSRLCVFCIGVKVATDFLNCYKIFSSTAGCWRPQQNQRYNKLEVKPTSCNSQVTMTRHTGSFSGAHQINDRHFSSIQRTQGNSIFIQSKSRQFYSVLLSTVFSYLWLSAMQFDATSIKTVQSSNFLSCLPSAGLQTPDLFCMQLLPP